MTSALLRRRFPRIGHELIVTTNHCHCLVSLPCRCCACSQDDFDAVLWSLPIALTVLEVGAEIGNRRSRQLANAKALAIERRQHLLTGPQCIKNPTSKFFGGGCFVLACSQSHKKDGQESGRTIVLCVLEMFFTTANGACLLFDTYTYIYIYAYVYIYIYASICVRYAINTRMYPCRIRNSGFRYGKRSGLHARTPKNYFMTSKDGI